MSDGAELAVLNRLLKKAERQIDVSPEAALRDGLKAYEQALSQGTKHVMGEGLYLSALACYRLSRYRMSLHYLERADELFLYLSDSFSHLKVNTLKGMIFSRLGQNDEALAAIQENLECSRSAALLEQELESLSQLGNLYFEIGNLDQAQESFQKARELADRLEKKDEVAQISGKLGHVYLHRGRVSLAAERLHEAEGLLKGLDNKIAEAEVLTLLGRLAQQQKQYPQAEAYHRSSLKLSREVGDRYGEIAAVINLGQLLLTREEYGIAEEELLEALKIAKSIDSVRQVSSIYRLLSQLASFQEEYKSALQYYRLYYAQEKELDHQQLNIQLGNMKDQFEIEKAREENILYRRKNEELENQSRQLEHYGKMMSQINHIGQCLTSSFRMKTVVFELFRNLISLLPVDRFLLYRLHPAGPLLYSIESEEKGVQQIYENEIRTGTPVHLCVVAKKPILIHRMEGFPGIEADKLLPVEQSASSIYLPFFSEDRILGVCGALCDRESAFNGSDIAFLQALGSFLSIAVLNAEINSELYKTTLTLQHEKDELQRAYQQIAHMAHHDNLTGLPNRRLLSEFLTQAFRKADREGTGIAVLYLDLDNFKPVNDQAGHETGDQVLKTAVERIQGSLRNSDIIARVGGDEFVAILVDVERKEAIETVSRKIIRSLSEPIRVMENAWNLGVSVGISCYPEDDRTIEGLLKKADFAMYRIKQKGKNNFCFYRPPD